MTSPVVANRLCVTVSFVSPASRLTCVPLAAFEAAEFHITPDGNES